MTCAPAGDGVKEDGDGVVGNLPRGHGLRQELSLELHREVAAGPNWNMGKMCCRIFVNINPRPTYFTSVKIISLTFDHTTSDMVTSASQRSQEAQDMPKRERKGKEAQL